MLPPESKFFYRRNLPHWQPAGASIFITWRLYGSLPESAIIRLRDAQRLLLREAERANEKAEERKLRHHKKVFAMLDRLLDAAESGPLWLREVAIADMIQEALLVGYSTLYKLWSYVVMPNHVHVLLRPNVAQTSVCDVDIRSSQTEVCATYVPLKEITKRIKGYTAREANRIMKRTGQTFWQAESFDHWARDDAEFYRIIDYIENNPVKVGLTARPEDWQWSSASERLRRGWHEIQALT